MDDNQFRYGKISKINDVNVDISFYLNNFELKLIPQDWRSNAITIRENKLFKKDFVLLKGTLTSGCCITLQLYAPQLINFLLPNSEKVITTHVGIYSISSDDDDISEAFDKIEFIGGTLDLVYPVGQIVEYQIENQTWNLKQDNIKKMYDVKCGDVDQVSYTIRPVISMKVGKIVDLNETHAIFEFVLNRKITIMEFVNYYNDLSNMLSFLCRQVNVRYFKISGSICENLEKNIDIYVRDSYNNYVDESENCMTVIRFNSIGANITDLYKLVKDDSVPNMYFLPDDNKTKNLIHYYSPAVIIASMEREYKYLPDDVKKVDAELAAQSSSVCDKLDEVIKNEICNERIKNKASKMLQSLRKIEPNSTEKFSIMMNIVIDDINSISDICSVSNHGDFWMEISNVKDELINMYGVMYKMRSLSVHNGINKMDDISEIYSFIEMIIYYFILKRINLKPVDILEILDNQFSRYIFNSFIKKQLERKRYEKES